MLAALIVAVELVAGGERVLLAQLQIDARGDIGARLRELKSPPETVADLVGSIGAWQAGSNQAASSARV